MAQYFLRKYGVQTTIDFHLFEVDGLAFRTDAAHAAGDSVIMKDEGAEGNTANAFTDEGTGYSLVLSATEMQAGRIVVYLVDQDATKVWLDDALVVETYGHASGQHALDFDDSVRGGMTALPNAAAEAAGGLPTSTAGTLDLDAMSVNIDDIEADTAVIGALGAGLTGIPWNAAWDAEVQSEVNDALVALGLDHLLGASVTGTDITDNSIIAKLVSASATADWDDFVNTTDSLQAVRDKLTDIETDTQDLQTQVGTAGAGLTAVAWNAAWDAEVESEVNDALVALGLDHLLGASVTGTDVTDNSIIAKLVSASATADWDDFVNTTDALQAIRDKQTDIETDTQAIETDTQDLQTQVGTAGAGLTAVVWNAAWDAEVESEVNDALVALGLDHLLGASVTGTDVTDNSIIAKLVSKSATADWDDFVNTTDALQAIRDKQTDIEADTDELQGDWTDAGRLDAILDLILADTGELQTDWVDAGRLDALLDGIKAVTDALPDSGALSTLQADTDDIQARLPDALVGGFIKADMVAISGDATAADNLERSAEGIVVAAAEGVPTSTSIPTDLGAGLTVDLYKGRIVVMTSGSAAGEATDITASAADGTLTVTTMVGTVAAADTLAIL